MGKLRLREERTARGVVLHSLRDLERDMFSAFAAWIFDCWSKGIRIHDRRLQSTTVVPTNLDFQAGADASYRAAVWLAAAIFRDAKVYRRDEPLKRAITIAIECTAPPENPEGNVELLGFDELVQRFEAASKAARDACTHNYVATLGSSSQACSKCPATRVVEGPCAIGRHKRSDDGKRCTACCCEFDEGLAHILDLDSRA